MTWLILAVIVYFLNAIVAVVDKFFIVHKAKDPLVYAFYVGLLNSLALFLWPFDFSFLSFYLIVIALLGGVCYFMAFFLLYSSMLKGEITRIISAIGGFSTLILFVLSYFFLHERLPGLWLVSSAILVVGSLFLFFERGFVGFENRINLFFFSFCAAFFFALSFFVTKVIFLETSFLNGFIWLRAGTFLTALLAFLVPFFRKRILNNPIRKSGKLSVFFVANKTLGATALILLSYAINLGSVTVVNALRGLEYIFIFMIALFFSFYYPRVIDESFSIQATIQKVIGIALISLGVVLLFVT